MNSTMNEDRELGETGQLLQVDGAWQIEDHEGDDGPTIKHTTCNPPTATNEGSGGTYICDLNRRYPMCRCCGAEVPPSMISGFTMLNWNKADVCEYYVSVGDEVMDFVYNGHLRKQLQHIIDYPQPYDEIKIAKEIDKLLTGDKP